MSARPLVLGRYDRALASYEMALAINPEAETRSAFVHMSQHSCSWSQIEPNTETLRYLVATGSAEKIAPFSFFALPNASAIEQFACARQYAEKDYGHFISRPDNV